MVKYGGKSEYNPATLHARIYIRLTTSRSEAALQPSIQVMTEALDAG
jgi:hypothetical protein